MMFNTLRWVADASQWMILLMQHPPTAIKAPLMGSVQ